MLKFLGNVGLDQLILPFILQMQEAIFETQILPNAEESFVNFWVFTLKDVDTQKQVLEQIGRWQTQHSPAIKNEPEYLSRPNN